VPKEKLFKVSAQDSQKIANEMAEVSKNTNNKGPRKPYSKAHEQRRRYVLSEAEATDQETETIIHPLKNREYKVVKGRWNISERDQARRKSICIRSCNQRSLMNVPQTSQENETEGFEQGIEEAIEKLKNLQLLDEERKERKPEIETETAKRQREKAPMDDTRQTTDDLRKLWKEFVLSERVKRGLYEKLPKLGIGQCRCAKARIGYPHWPPTSEGEALRQFEYVRNEHNAHRRNLVLRW